MIDTIILSICIISLGICLLLSREFVKVSEKREELFEVFHGNMRSTKRSKSILIFVYVVLTLLFTIGLSIPLLYSF
ncbi:MAG: hypothetical protein KC680_01700 [Candidatus Peregrinibacteria bacterium]|nr:hypothetical protein [Candidatus Peregrinibacteria bacterium]MCB9807651.1 hypothetical protein [Candidatus Peribacteria bacterium]